jgi:hypothetical protein
MQAHCVFFQRGCCRKGEQCNFVHAQQDLQDLSARKQSDLEDSILHQVEFYFGDENFSKDTFLQHQCLYGKDGYIPLSLIANFPRMRKLTSDLKLIVHALERSTVVQLSPDKTMIRKRDLSTLGHMFNQYYYPSMQHSLQFSFSFNPGFTPSIPLIAPPFCSPYMAPLTIPYSSLPYAAPAHPAYRAAMCSMPPHATASYSVVLDQMSSFSSFVSPVSSPCSSHVIGSSNNAHANPSSGGLSVSAQSVNAHLDDSSSLEEKFSSSSFSSDGCQEHYSESCRPPLSPSARPFFPAVLNNSQSLTPAPTPTSSLSPETTPTDSPVSRKSGDSANIKSLSALEESSSAMDKIPPPLSLIMSSTPVPASTTQSPLTWGPPAFPLTSPPFVLAPPRPSLDHLSASYLDVTLHPKEAQGYRLAGILFFRFKDSYNHGRCEKRIKVLMGCEESSEEQKRYQKPEIVLAFLGGQKNAADKDAEFTASREFNASTGTLAITVEHMAEVLRQKRDVCAKPKSCPTMVFWYREARYALYLYQVHEEVAFSQFQQQQGRKVVRLAWVDLESLLRKINDGHRKGDSIIQEGDMKFGVLGLVRNILMQRPLTAHLHGLLALSEGKLKERSLNKKIEERVKKLHIAN